MSKSVFLKKIRELAEKLSNIKATQFSTDANLEVDPADSMSAFKALEMSNQVGSPFGPVVTDWHYPMYPASLITNLRNAPYPYSQAYASLSRITLSADIPDILYCTIDKRDRGRLPEDGIRVGTIFYTEPDELDGDIVLKVTVPEKIKKKFYPEDDYYVSVAQIRHPYFKVIHETR